MKIDVQESKRLRFGWRAPFGATLLVFAGAILMGSANAHLTLSRGRGNTSTPTVGGRIAFSGRRDGPTNNIYTMDPDGSNVTRLTTTNTGVDASPDWSADGSMIAFISNRSGSPAIYVMNANGGNQHMLPPSSTNSIQGYPRWSPDGTKIAFEAWPTGETVFQIFVMNADGSNATQLTDITNSGALFPTWSPDGTEIAFREEVGSDTRIAVMNANGGNQHTITSGHRDNEPAWSPDGNKIAYERDSSGADKGIWIMNPDGSNQTQVTYGLGGASPSWSPDSLQIAFAGGVSPEAGIFVVDADGNNPHYISNGATFDSEPDWGLGTTSAVVLVQNAQGTPIPNAQVWRNPRGISFSSAYVGTTDMSGTLSLPAPQLNEYLIARSLVYTGTTNKEAHDDWFYHVWATNIVQQNDGLQTAFLITDTNQLTQTLVVTTTGPLIGFNILASVEFNATPDELSTIAHGLSDQDLPNDFYSPGATDYLQDVTDGQMFFEKVTVYEDKQHWDDADYQFFADYLRGDTNYPLGVPQSSLTHIHVQASGDFGTPWDQTTAFSTLVHEFGHYAIGAYDEYYFERDGDTSSCSLVPALDYDYRASIMDHNRTSSEFCTIDNHNPQTNQGLRNGESVWQTLQRKWTDTMGRWTIVTPTDRGFIDPGPGGYISRQTHKTDTTVVSSVIAACAPVMVTVVDILGNPVQAATLSLQHNGNVVIGEGSTDINGQRLVYGAVSNLDKVTAFHPVGIPLLRTASADITSCGPITLTLATLLAADVVQPDASATQWPSHWLTATADYSQTQVNATLHFMSDPPDQPLLYASQGGTNRQQLALTYDPAGHNYTGTYPLDLNVATDFQFEVGITGTNGLDLFPYRFDAAQFHTTGPSNQSDSPGVSGVNNAPSDWDLFGPESPANLSVKPNSLPDGTGVMAGQVILPASPPNDLLIVGGPISVQGENPISGTVRLSMAYQSEQYCGLQSSSIAIYRYNGTGWDALTTLINEDWHGAAADITQWGIYGVFAQPNSQATFSDVPAGSTYHDYIGWITCHGIASGYADGTFRPSNNASRGQISKMMALTYSWHLDPPSGQSNTQSEAENIKWRWNTLSDPYTFADVLPGSTFFLYVEAAYREGVVSGYPCGGTGEPCDAQNRPYFRPSNNVTRGQIAKIVSNGSKFTDTVTGQTFEDVVPGSTFYDYIGRMASRSIINGYPCGGVGEPCGAGNRPYFRPNSNATRGQLSKMIYLAASPR